MIIEAIFNILMMPIDFVISLLPTIDSLPSWISDTITFVGYGLQVFPQDVWVLVLINVLFWIVALISWAIVEWVYKKVPGID